MSMKITHLLSLWLKYPLSWTSHSISFLAQKMAPAFHITTSLFWKGLFSLGLRWPKPYPPHFVVSCQMEMAYIHICVFAFMLWAYMRDTNTYTQRQRKEGLRWRESFSEGESCQVVFRFVCHFLIVWLKFFFKSFLSVTDGCVIFAIVEWQWKHWQFWQGSETREFLEENNLICYIRAFLFCFFLKRSQFN